MFRLEPDRLAVLVEGFHELPGLDQRIAQPLVDSGISGFLRERCPVFRDCLPVIVGYEVDIRQFFVECGGAGADADCFSVLQHCPVEEAF